MDNNFLRKKLQANILFIIVLVSPVQSRQACDAKCPSYRLDSVELPIPSTAYWWPGSEGTHITFSQDFKLTSSVSEDLRNQWHQVQLERYTPTDVDTPPTSFSLKIPSLGVSNSITCHSLECMNIKLSTPTSAWALECEGVPCGCPSFLGHCKSQTVTNEECKEVSLLSLEVPLDRRSRVFWLPKRSASHLDIQFGNPKFRMEIGRPFTWVEIEVDAYFVTAEASNGSTHHVCYISIEKLNFHESCSGADVLSLASKTPEVFALGCQEEPKGELGRGSPVVPIGVIVCAVIGGLLLVGLVIFVIRRMPCIKRPRSPATGE